MHVHPDFPDFTAATSSTGRGSVGSGSCTRCGTHRQKKDGGVVDIDIRFYGEGAVVLCWPCAQEIGSLTGMATPQKVAKLEARIAALEDALAERDADLAAVAHLRDALDLIADVSA